MYGNREFSGEELFGSVYKKSWKLDALTPEYLESEHEGYVETIEAALGKSHIRNIALSGNYGVGKSSILGEVARRQKGRIVELSLSTLAPIEESKIDDSVPIQATTPTNRIQQEIVKQLLYREDPNRMPASRFRWIERFRLKHETVSALLLGSVIAVIFLLTGWTVEIATALTAQSDIGVWTHFMAAGVAAIVLLLARWLYHGRLHIKQLSAGSATVTLDDNSVSYFDQYLDEIVYFFEVSGRDVVIFEDIDRFDDSHIFETLRALNTLLNASPQINKPVRFIYAIKDSIFDNVGLRLEGRKFESSVFKVNDPAQSESMRANRTKFFDLIIPVVPFVTHRSARNIAVQLLGKIDHKVEPELLDLSAQYVPDMRLLKNVCNEFVVFRDRIFSGDGKQLNLSETELFAMMLYKSTHLTDFETIRLGTSKLDVLYKVSRALVAENIKRIESELRVLRQRATLIDRETTRSAILGERLIAHVQRTAEAVGYSTHNATFSFDRASRSTEDLKGASFWADFAKAKEDEAVLKWNAATNYGRVSLTFSRKNLAAALDDTLDAERWDEADRKALNEQIDERTENIRFLRSADLGDLVKRPEFLVVYKQEKQSLESIAEALLTLGLACQLVRAGYLNRNFTLYTSTFHGNRVSPAATNFIIHHVERDLMDEYFELAPDDVDAVVRERGKNGLKEPALYNIAILDRLLVTDVNAADIMTRSLVGLGLSQKRFLQAYLTAGEQRRRFLERFTGASTQVLIYLVSQAELDESSRIELLDVALAHLPESKRRTDVAVSEYLAAHYAEFSVLTSDATTSTLAEPIGALFADASVILPSLEVLGRYVRPSFVSRNLYKITHENLSIVIDNKVTVALDVIRAANKTVYAYVLSHLQTYLDAVENASATIDASENFIAVIEDVLEQASSCLDDVVERASPACELADIAEAPEGVWPALLKHKRVPATFNNVSRYFVALESVDAPLGRLLSAAGKISETGVADEELKPDLAIAILAATIYLPSAALRAGLVASLKLNKHLDVENVKVEKGDLFALLLKHDIIADEAKSYEHLAATDWPTRKGFIRESKDFLSYMTPELVKGDLEFLLSSSEISSAVKVTVVEQSVEYAEVAGPKGLEELARYAAQNEHEIPSNIVQRMAEKGVASQYVVKLLSCHIGSISSDQLFIVLQALSGDYPKLTEVGHDKPRIPNTPFDRALLERLKLEGIVGKYDDQESPIKVNKKYK
ncbi:DNA-binding protein [Salinicola acroporae]|uniref:YobI family P-loop NTPase n=1 Tax=Salinicola acroporae TaxID=1541440 RepID=UPI0019800983|nr:DNA-binding protein [Salinicola acroporae]